VSRRYQTREIRHQPAIRRLGDRLKGSLRSTIFP
jgi:hypothetical protein